MAIIKPLSERDIQAIRKRALDSRSQERVADVDLLDREILRLADQLSDCWLFLDDIARAEKGSRVGDVRLFVKHAAQRILKRQQAPGWKEGP